MAAPKEKADEEDAVKKFQEDDDDAFFDQLLTDAGVPPEQPAKGMAKNDPAGDASVAGSEASTASSASVASHVVHSLSPSTSKKEPGSAEDGDMHDIESEYAELARIAENMEAGKKARSEKAPLRAGDTGGAEVMSYALSDGSDNEGSDAETLPFATQQDLRPPKIPDAPADFTSEDLALRATLADFYLRYKAANLSNINMIVKKYAGRGVSHLWAQLVLKYGLQPWEGVELLSRTIYTDSPFEYANEEQAMLLEEVLGELQQQGDAVATPPTRAELMRRAIQRGAKDGFDGALRMLSFRGIPDEPGLRSQCWKVLLSYLPMDRHSEWNAIQGEKRALYASYRAELLNIGDGGSVQISESGHRSAELAESRDMLQEIQNDVDRTRRDFDFFRRPATRTSLCSLLYVYARLNPGVRYVQGMNEVAAVMFHVMSGDHDNAEADTFWCFSELMVEIKEGFMQALDNTGEGVAGVAGGVARLVKAYDPELSKHLQKVELPSFVFALRWCTVLFAQDTTLPDVERLWDSFIADPRRFEFVVHVAVSAILGRREELLASDKQFELAEILQDAPRNSDFDILLRRSWAIIAFERRKQTPPFPPKSALQVVDELQEWAHSAANKAQEVSAEVSRTLQENIAPAVLEKAGQASTVAAVVASDGAQAVQAWLEDTAPARKEAMEKAQTQLSSLWTTVRTTSAIAVSKGQALAAEVRQSEAADSAATKLTSAADSAASAASGLFGRFAGYAAAAAAKANSANAGGASGYPGGGQEANPPIAPAPGDIPNTGSGVSDAASEDAPIS